MTRTIRNIGATLSFIIAFVFIITYISTLAVPGFGSRVLYGSFVLIFCVIGFIVKAPPRSIDGMNNREGSKIIRRIRNILATICFIIAALLIFMWILSFFIPELEGGLTVISFGVLILVAGVIVQAPSQYSIDTRIREELGILAFIDAFHTDGLPIAENTKCEIQLTQEQLSIEGGGTNFSLKINQIGAVEVRTFSVVSAATFGAGAGTRTIYRPNHSYLIVNYRSTSSEINAIIFDVSFNFSQSQKLEKKLKDLIQNNPQNVIHL